MDPVESPRTSAGLTGQHIYCVLCLLLSVFALGLFDMVSGDIWWHLRAGQLIRERGTVPHVDWFSYTSSEAHWIDLHWGFQVICSWLWGLGGERPLVVCKAT